MFVLICAEQIFFLFLLNLWRIISHKTFRSFFSVLFVNFSGFSFSTVYFISFLLFLFTGLVTHLVVMCRKKREKFSRAHNAPFHGCSLVSFVHHCRCSIISCRLFLCCLIFFCVLISKILIRTEIAFVRATVRVRVRVNVYVCKFWFVSERNGCIYEIVWARAGEKLIKKRDLIRI